MLEILPHHLACSVYIQIVVQSSEDCSWETEKLPPEIYRKLLIEGLKFLRNSSLKWTDLKRRVKVVATSAMFKKFVMQVNDIQQLDNLYETVKSLEQLFSTESFLCCYSVMGLFLRKYILAFRKLQFHSVCNFLLSVKIYLNETIIEGKMDISLCSVDVEKSFQEKENIEHDDLCVESSDANHFIISSRKEAERFINAQCKKIVQNEYTILNPQQMQEMIKNVQQAYPDLCDVHYLSFLNHLRLMNVEKAVSCLQLYFDFKVFLEEKDLEKFSLLEKHQLQFKRFCYCALSLGMMRCCHGNYAQAEISLDEAVRIAQETNDEKCLKHAMFWLKVVAEETGKNKRKFDLYCDLKLDYENSQIELIDYLGSLRATRLLVYDGKLSPPNSLARTTEIVCANHEVMDTACLVRSSLLSFFGCFSMSASLCQIPLHIVKQESSSDILINPTSFTANENQILSLCQTAHHLSIQGLYKEAYLILQHMESQVPLYSRHRTVIHLCELQMNFQHAVTTRTVENIEEFPHYAYILDSVESKYMSIVVDIVLGDVAGAQKKVKKTLNEFLSSDQYAYISPLVKAKFLLLRVEIHLLSGYHVSAIPHLLELIVFCEKYHLSNVNCDAQLYLAKVYTLNKMYGKAQVLLQSMKLEIFSNGTCNQKGLLFLLLAQTKTALIQNLKKSKTLLKSILKLLEKGLEYFEKGCIISKKRDVYFEQAMIFNELGKLTERNIASGLYKKLNEKLNSFPDIFIF